MPDTYRPFFPLPTHIFDGFFFPPSDEAPGFPGPDSDCIVLAGEALRYLGVAGGSSLDVLELGASELGGPGTAMVLSGTVMPSEEAIRSTSDLQ